MNTKMSSDFGPIVYDALSPSLREVVDQLDPGPQRDGFLLALLATQSAVLAQIRTFYGKRYHFLPIFLLIIAPSGAGKGLIALARRTAEKVDSRLREKSMMAWRDWKKAQSNTRLADEGEPPINEGEPPIDEGEPPIDEGEPLIRSLFIAGNVTYAAWMERLGANKGIGLMFETEAATLVTALKGMYGQFLDLILKVFHHETLSVDRKGKHPLTIETPRMAIVLTTTRSFAIELVGDVRTGALSRWIVFGMELEHEWVDQFEDARDKALESGLEQLGDLADEAHRELEPRDEPLTLRLTLPQQKRLSNVFAAEYDRLVDEGGEELCALPQRHALTAIRLAGVIAGLRLAETKGALATADYLEPEDAEVEAAIAIALACLPAAEALAADAGAGRKKPIVEVVSKALPDGVFRTADVLAQTQSARISRRSTERALAVLVKSGRLRRLQKGVYENQGGGLAERQNGTSMRDESRVVVDL